MSMEKKVQAKNVPLLPLLRGIHRVDGSVVTLSMQGYPMKVIIARVMKLVTSGHVKLDAKGYWSLTPKGLDKMGELERGEHASGA